MTWKFDQRPNVACITCKNVMRGSAVLTVTHYEDDHSWGFLDGKPVDPAEAMIVAMGSVVDLHPDLDEIADLKPGFTASRTGKGEPWVIRQDD